MDGCTADNLVAATESCAPDLAAMSGGVGLHLQVVGGAHGGEAAREIAVFSVDIDELVVVLTHVSFLLGTSDRTGTRAYIEVKVDRDRGPCGNGGDHGLSRLTMRPYWTSHI